MPSHGLWLSCTVINFVLWLFLYLLSYEQYNKLINQLIILTANSMYLYQKGCIISIAGRQRDTTGVCIEDLLSDLWEWGRNWMSNSISASRTLQHETCSYGIFLILYIDLQVFYQSTQYCPFCELCALVLNFP